MITRTMSFYGLDVNAINVFEEAGWAVRQIVFEPKEEGYTPTMVVVFERDAE